MITSAFSFALMMTFVHLAGDLPTFQKAFFRNAVAMLFALAVLLKDPSMFKAPKRSYKYLFLRSAAGTIGLVCNFYAIDRLVLADASILNKMSPFFTLIFSAIFLTAFVISFLLP